MTCSEQAEPPTEQSVYASTTQDADQSQHNLFHGCFEWIQDCCSGCSSIRTLPSFLGGFFERCWGLLRNRNTELEGNNGIVLQPENVSSYPAYMEVEDSSPDRQVKSEQPFRNDSDSLVDLEIDCDSLPIMNCLLQMSDASKFSIE